MLKRLWILVALLSGKPLSDNDLRLVQSLDQRAKSKPGSGERAEKARAAVERRIADLEAGIDEMRSLRREFPQAQDPFPATVPDWLLSVAVIVLLVVLIAIVMLAVCLR